MAFEVSTKVIVFKMADQFFGVDVGQVMSIERLADVTFIPQSPRFVKGVINLRGVITPVVDLRERLGLSSELVGVDSRLIVVRIQSQDIALIVDAANDVMDIENSQIEAPPSVMGELQSKYLHGVAKLKDRLLVLLNLDQILSKQEVEEAQRIAGD